MKLIKFPKEEKQNLDEYWIYACKCGSTDFKALTGEPDKEGNVQFTGFMCSNCKTIVEFD